MRGCAAVHHRKAEPAGGIVLDQASAQSDRSSADDDHVDFHPDHFHSNSYGTSKAGNPFPLFIR